jgi:uncharacterized protein YfaS (alpha-2-macroglobulin family)
VLAGYISTERGIYRPGHTVYLHGALRSFRAWRGRPEEGREVTVKLVARDRTVVASVEKKLDEHGVFLAKLEIPKEVRLGYYKAELFADDEKVASDWFKIAEYRQPRFRVRVSAKKDEVWPDDVVKLRGVARYLFGGPMDGARYRLSVTRYPSSWYPKAQPKHRVGASWWLGVGRKVWKRTEGTLDSKGVLTTHLRLKEQGAELRSYVCRHQIELEVVSPSRRTVAARTYLTQHPGERQVGVKRLPPGKKNLKRHLIVVNRRGEAAPKTKVEVAVRRVEKSGGLASNKPLWTKDLYVKKRGRVVEIPWPEDVEGRRLAITYRAVDDRGRAAISAEIAYAPSWFSRQWQRKEHRREKRQSQLRITTDKKRYLPGQKAKITVKRKGPSGAGMLFVERERVFSTHLLSFDRRGVATVEIPVTGDLSQEVDLRAVVVRRGKKLRSELGPLVSVTEPLRVSPKPFHLDIAIKTEKKTYRPGEQVRVDLAVTDGLKRPRKSRVVIMAVDEAVLQLTGFRLPDPYRSLHHTPPSDVVAEDSRRRLLPLEPLVLHRDHPDLSISGMGMGGSGRGGGGSGGGGFGLGGLGTKHSKKVKSRRRFLTTAWHATLVTDEHGRANASFKLPDNLTEYRLMAFAVDDSRSAGKGHSSFKVDLPLLALPAMPRFLRAGDRFTAGVVVYNTGLDTGPAKVSVESTSAVEIKGKRVKTVRVPKGGSRRVDFAFEAVRKGNPAVTFSVQMENVTDRVVERLPVKLATHMEASSVSGQTKGAVKQGVEPLSGLRPDKGGLEVSLASTVLVGIEDGMEQLIQYPYGCLEQVSSRLLPLIAASVFEDRFDLDLKKDTRSLIRTGLGKLLAMQRSDGGFGYWPMSWRSYPWPTAYALIVLHRLRLAKKATGIDVPERSIRKALAYLSDLTKAPERLGPYWWAYESFLLYALGLYDHDFTHLYDQVIDLHSKRHRKPLFARAMLLATTASLIDRIKKAGPRGTDKNDTRRQKRQKLAGVLRELTEETIDSLRVDGTWAHAEENLHDGYKVLMHSNDRTTAMVLLALLQARPRHVMVPRLVRWFLLGRKQARYRNTQEAAWALMSLWDYARIREQEKPDFEAGVWLGDRRIVTAEFRKRSAKPEDARIRMADLMKLAGKTARDIIIAKRGAGTLYYVARLRYARKKLPEKPRDHGMEVTRTVRVLDKSSAPLPKSRKPRVGDTVVVTLRVKANEARRYVVVEDPLPAGLEAIDTTLATAGRSFGARRIFKKTSWYDHKELRDDRALFFRDHMQPGTLTYRYLARVTSAGAFMTPPTKAEEMYTPEVFGHTAARRVTYAR